MTARLRFSLFGHPVRHSVSPAMCGAAFTALGLPHVYTAIDVPSAAGLSRVIDDLRHGALAGCNITVPYKKAVLTLADARAESVEEAGAANVLARDASGRITAHNTDAEALARDIDAEAPGRPRVRAAIIGSGGAALAALVACRRLGFRLTCMTSRSWTNTEAMFASEAAHKARSLGALTAPWPTPDSAAPTGKASQALRLQWSDMCASADVIIQCTSAGMLGGDPGAEVSGVVPWARLPKHALAYDVVYNPRITPFLSAARDRGLHAVDGLGMLVRQAALAIQIWLGVTPPLDRMRAAAEEALDGAMRQR